MSALITGTIPDQNFEIIRDAIVSILGVEYANQYTLNNTLPNIDKIWTERFIPFDSETEVPTINVSIDRGDYDNETIKKQDGTYLFNIDIYTNASTTVDTPADKAAMISMSKVVGKVRAILSNPVYQCAGSILGLQGVFYSKVERFFIADKRTVRDALSDVVGRLQFTVKAIEIATIPAPTNLVLESRTRIILQDGINGFYFDLAPYLTDENNFPLTDENNNILNDENLN